MPLFFLGTREWRNRQTRTVQVRVPVMEWGFNSPLAHDETADPSGSAVFVFPGCCLRPHGCSGRRVCFVRPGCLLGLAAVCAGGRRPAREPSRRVLLLVAPRVFRAPEGPAAREARASLRSAPRLEARPCPPVPPAPSTPVGLGRCCLVRCVVSKPGQVPPPPTGTAASPCGPSCGCFVGGSGGFCAMRSPLAACRRRVGGLDGVIPPVLRL